MIGEVTLRGATRGLEGPLLFVERHAEVGLNEAVDVVGEDGRDRAGRVAAIDEEQLVIEVLESTSGLGLRDTRVRIRGRPLEIGLGRNLLGRIFDGAGRPIDGGPPVPAEHRWRIDGLSISPVARDLPRDLIETGVTAIDLLNSLVRGQKLPLFSAGGLPHDRLAIRIARSARLRREREGRFAIVFAGIGVPYDSARAFRAAMEESGALAHTALFLNHADEPSAQRLSTPRYALTAAEYLAFVEGRHVLVILTDMTNYCEALREVSASHGEVPSRKGYPGYMYSDLASIFERAGCIHGRPGTLTQLPIVTMPADDISHPIPDLTGYITEGQIVLSRSLDIKGIDPPIDVLPSLSRLMSAGTGKGYTHADHPALAHQLFAAYSRAVRVRVLASVLGEEGLPDSDRAYLEFGEAFERRLIHQDAPRTLEESMELGWSLLRYLPRVELTRLSAEQLRRFSEEPDDS